MPKSRVIVNFTTNKYSDAELVARTKAIVDSMLGNATFQTLESAVTGLKATNDNFADLVSKALDGGKSVIAQKNSSRIDLENELGSIGVKVQDVSGGSDLVIRSSGYEIRRKSEPVGELERPVNLIVVPGTRTGTLTVSWNVIPNAMMYEVQYAKAPITGETIWSWLTCSKHNVTIENLIPGDVIYVKVAGAGSDPRRVWSDVINSYVI